MIRCVITDDTGVMSLNMSEEGRRDLLAMVVGRYRGRSRAGRSRLRDEVCELELREAYWHLDSAPA